MKYYISTGNLRRVISYPDINTPLEAAAEVCLMHYNSNTEADSIIRVSQRGFGVHDDDVILDTEEVLKKAGFLFDEELN